jgi:hypothetical protein
VLDYGMPFEVKAAAISIQQAASTSKPDGK